MDVSVLGEHTREIIVQKSEAAQPQPGKQLLPGSPQRAVRGREWALLPSHGVFVRVCVCACVCVSIYRERSRAVEEERGLGVREPVEEAGEWDSES